MNLFWRVCIGGVVSFSGVQNDRPTRFFSFIPDTVFSPRVWLRINTNHAVPIPSLTYGGVPMTCIDKGRHAAPDTEFHFEILNPPMGSQVITGQFVTDVLYMVQLFDGSERVGR